jgi:membrane-associated phospholipid phosphatase
MLKLSRYCYRVSPVVAVAFGMVVSPMQAQETPSQGIDIKWWHGAAAVGVYALLTTFDNSLHRLAQDNRSGTGNRIARFARHMGQPEVFVTAGLGVLATGLISGNDRVRDAGMRISSSLALAGTIVTLGKLSAGRQRPSHPGADGDEFQPFSGNASAPSGHTAMAFALATSLSDEIHNRWVTVGLYTMAAATGWSRVNDNAHWASDVVAGAALGIVSAKFINGRLRLFGLRSPLVSASSNGVSLSWSGNF